MRYVILSKDGKEIPVITSNAVSDAQIDTMIVDLITDGYEVVSGGSLEIVHGMFSCSGVMFLSNVDADVGSRGGADEILIRSCDFV